MSYQRFMQRSRNRIGLTNDLKEKIKMDKEKNKRVIGRPFSKNDPRINKSGRPRSFDQLRALAQQIGNQLCKDEHGNTLTVAEAVLRKLVQSNDSRALQIFLEYGYGKPVETIEATGLENNKTLILHFGHEREKVERGQQRLLDNGNFGNEKIER
jgi:hypothetical protein